MTCLFEVLTSEIASDGFNRNVNEDSPRGFGPGRTAFIEASLHEAGLYPEILAWEQKK
jgi:hypothetical protein